jgi:hypothetical protein
VRGPGAFVANWSFFKNFKLSERGINLQFRYGKVQHLQPPEFGNAIARERSRWRISSGKDFLALQSQRVTWSSLCG